MSDKTNEKLTAIARAALEKSSRPAKQFWREEICYVVQKHVDEQTPVNSFKDFYEVCAETLQKEYQADLTASTIQRQYADWREETGVDEVAYVNSQIKAQQQGFKAGGVKKAIGGVDKEEAKPGFGAELEVRPRQNGQQ